MPPADQGFGADYLAGAHVDLGLVEQLEFLLLECLRDALQAFVMRLRQPVFFRVEQVVAVFSRLLGLIHGLVGVPQQGIGIAAVLREEGDPQTGG